MVQCFVAECDHSYSKNQCSFFRLPSNIRTRRKWEQLCGRPPDCSNENSRICSCHFEGGTKSTAPSVFKWTENKLSCFTGMKEEPDDKDIMSEVPGCISSLSSAETRGFWGLNPQCSCQNPAYGSTVSAGGDETIMIFKQEETQTQIS